MTDVICKRIIDLKEEKDLKQRKVAEALNISRSTYANYEIGTNKIPIEILAKLAKYYNTSVDYIIGLTNERTPYPPIK